MAIINVELPSEGKRAISLADSWLMNEENLRESVLYLIRCLEVQDVWIYNVYF